MMACAAGLEEYVWSSFFKIDKDLTCLSVKVPELKISFNILLASFIISVNDLVDFAKRTEKAVLDTVADGKMTGDLALITTKSNVQVMDLDGFLTEVASKL